MLKESAEAYQQAIRLKPDFARAYYNLGVCHVAAGNTDAALEQYHLLRSLDADRAARLYNVIYP
jgi:predicted TPR repeat methyltransferase